MELPDILRSARRNWPVLTLATLVGLGAGTAINLAQTPEYQSTAKAFVSTGSATSVSDLSQVGTFSQQAVKSYADLATTSYVLAGVIHLLHLPYSPQELAAKVTATAPTDEVVLEVSATDSSPAVAADIANAVTQRLSMAVAQLTPNTGTTAAIRLTQIEAASPATTPILPKIPFNIGLGILFGLVAGIFAVALREKLDTRVRTIADVETITDRPVLGAVSFDPNTPVRPVALRDPATPRRAEEYRSLRANLQFLRLDDRSRSFVVTSSVAGEGKSTTAINLATAMADAGQPVILVDADLRDPQVANYLGIDGGLGLTDVLIGAASLDAATQAWGDGSLMVLPAGRPAPNPNELMQSKAMMELIETLTLRHGTVIFDAPPLLPVSDAAILARRAGGALLVCAANRVRAPQARAALASLRHIDAHILGVIVTMVSQGGSGGYGYGNGYGYRTEDSLTSMDRDAALSPAQRAS